MAPINRRRHDRSALNPRSSLERALDTWRILLGAWGSVLEGARAAKNWERMALAEAKLDECEAEVARLEGLVRSLPE